MQLFHNFQKMHHRTEIEMTRVSQYATHRMTMLRHSSLYLSIPSFSTSPREEIPAVFNKQSIQYSSLQNLMSSEMASHTSIHVLPHDQGGKRESPPSFLSISCSTGKPWQSQLHHMEIYSFYNDEKALLEDSKTECSVMKVATASPETSRAVMTSNSCIASHDILWKHYKQHYIILHCHNSSRSGVHKTVNVLVI